APGFVTAPAPGLLTICRDEYYRDRERLLLAAADALAHEYRFIVESGLELQVDCPDLPGCWSRRTRSDGRRVAELHLAALRHALDGLAPERVRLHVCWGNAEAPHDEDVELEAFAELLLSMPVQTLVLEAANPRHAHECRVWKDIPLGHKHLIVGVIDS